MRLVNASPFGAQAFNVLLDTDTAFSLPTQNQRLGTTYLVMDNLDLGLTVNITGLFAAGSSVITVSGVSGWGMRFTWGGTFYVVG